MPDVSHDISMPRCDELEVLLEQAIKANPHCPECMFLRRRAIVHEQAGCGTLEALAFLRASTWPIEPCGPALFYGRVTQSQGQSEYLQAVFISKLHLSDWSAAGLFLQLRMSALQNRLSVLSLERYAQERGGRGAFGQNMVRCVSNWHGLASETVRNSARDLAFADALCDQGEFHLASK